MLILAAVLGALRYQVETALLPVNHISSMPELLGESGPGSAKGRLSGIVDGEPDERADHAKLVIRLHTFESEQGETYQIAGTALVSMRNAAISIDHADEVTLQGRLARPQPARNPGAFDYRRFLELRGIHGVLSVRRAEQIISVRKRSGGVLHEWVVSPGRQTVRRVIGRNLSGEPAGLLRGILLGEKQAISERLRDDFRTTGLAHALVISGLHVGLVALFFFSGFRLCRLSDSAASLATVGVLTTFAFVTELQAPVVRASIMAAVVLEQMEVDHFVDSGQTCDTWTARRIRELIHQQGVSYHRVAAGDSLLGLGGVGALILHPTAEFVDEEGTSAHGLNNGSTVLRLDYGGTSLLFTGDAEVETDAPILRWGKRLRADILKVAHHGSPTSSRQSFVGHLRPETAVISVGAVNNFGHPSAEELERFREQGTVLYRTDRCGAVMAQIDVSGQTTWQTMLGNCSAPVGTAVSAVP
jgi:uncharacterized membrane protein (UPF0136 family)